MKKVSWKEEKERLKKLVDSALQKPLHLRTYAERHDIWLYNHFSGVGTFSKEWDEGESVEILDGEALSNGTLRHEDPRQEFPEWFRELGKHFGKKVRQSHNTSGKIYTFLGLEYTFEDYYYILEDPETKKLTYSSCVGGIELVEDEDNRDNK